MVEKGLLREVSRGRSTRELGRTEQFIVFEYEHRHDLVSCKCNNCYIDGGQDYLHFGGNDFNKILIIFDDGTEILASHEEEYKNKYDEWEDNRIKELTKNESINN